jgi:spectinomycin phosphotransferase
MSRVLDRIVRDSCDVRSPGPVLQAPLHEVIATQWALSLDGLAYLPEGGGAYHWVAHRDGEPQWFVTLDDLDTTFVVAPTRTRAGAAAVRVDERHCLCVLPYVDGEPGQWGQPAVPEELAGMLAELHRATPHGGGHPLPRRGLEVPGRTALEDALGDFGTRWGGDAQRRVVAWLAELDQLDHALGPPDDSALVVTHGEPHPGNLIRTRGGLVLIDWDTVALARPERDLWMLGAEQTKDPVAARAYRLLWALSDIAAFTARLRAVPDDEWSRAGLHGILDGREPAPYGPGQGAAKSTSAALTVPAVRPGAACSLQ